MHKDRKNNR